jgi:CheY-like chemotaxis protein
MEKCIHPVLVVDDDEAIRDTLAEVLADEGYRVLRAENGLKALEIMRSADPPPCVVVLDLMMPVMNGLEVLEKVRDEPALADSAIIVITAFTERGTGEVQRLAPQVRERMQKPLKLGRLLALVEEFCHEEVAA